MAKNSNKITFSDLTLFSRILILICFIALIIGGIFGAKKLGIIKGDKDFGIRSMDELMDADGNVVNTEKSSSDTINLSIDEWIG